MATDRRRRLSPEQEAALYAEQAPGRLASRINAHGLWVQRTNPVRPGYWLVRARVGPREWGPLCPAAIMRVHTTEEPEESDNKMERSPFWAAFVAGQPVSIWSLQQETHTAGERIYRREQEISFSEYSFRISEQDWVRQYAPNEPIADPHKSIDLLQATLPF